MLFGIMCPMLASQAFYRKAESRAVPENWELISRDSNRQEHANIKVVGLPQRQLISVQATRGYQYAKGSLPIAVQSLWTCLHEAFSTFSVDVDNRDYSVRHRHLLQRKVTELARWLGA
ncbi:MAG: hypothetical protein OEZ05_02985 [Nitrospirota bacterium]|nr:hypothetical protein [Nitrospirota bacterium]